MYLPVIVGKQNLHPKRTELRQRSQSVADRHLVGPGPDACEILRFDKALAGLRVTVSA